jgi:hypothetical protein
MQFSVPMTDQIRNEGEGSRTAARSYYAKLRTFIRENRVDPAAREAKRFVNSHPGEAAQAERKAKAGPRPVLRRVEDLVTAGKAAWNWARARMQTMLQKRIHHA